MTNTEIKEVIKILKKEGCNSKKQAIEYLEKKALQQSQKQEKLLELYRKLDDCIVSPTGHHVCRYTDDEKYARIRKQIKELEVKQKKDKEQE